MSKPGPGGHGGRVNPQRAMVLRTVEAGEPCRREKTMGGHVRQQIAQACYVGQCRQGKHGVIPAGENDGVGPALIDDGFELPPVQAGRIDECDVRPEALAGVITFPLNPVRGVALAASHLFPECPGDGVVLFRELAELNKVHHGS